MAAEGNDMQAHVRSYSFFAGMMKWGAVVCFIIGLVVLWLIY
jgi:hypothetical protein